MRSQKTLSRTIEFALAAGATVTLFATVCAFTFNAEIVAMIRRGATDPQMSSDVVLPLLIIFGLCACFVALSWIVLALVKARRTEESVRMRAQRGTIVVETLIVLPVFLLLTFGMAQMAINALAGLMSTLASYEVARTLAVWAPEEGNRATRAQITDRARTVAAGVLAPIVPTGRSGNCTTSGSAVELLIRGMQYGGVNTTDAYSEDMGDSFAIAFDTQTFANRGAAKLRRGYCNTEVTWTGPASTSTETSRSGQVNARLRYFHPVAMPLVGPIFTTSDTGGTWATPYVTTYDKSYELGTYLTPNTYPPYADPNPYFSAVP